METYLDMVDKAFEGENFKSMLDVGCADGSIDEHLKLKFDADYYGIDWDNERLKKTNIKTKLLDITKKDWGITRKFDLAFSMATLIVIAPEFIETVIRNIKKLVKRIIIIDLHSEERDEYGGIVSGNMNFPPRYVRNMRKLLSKHKFKDIELIKIDKQIRPWPGRGSYEDDVYIIKANV